MPDQFSTMQAKILASQTKSGTRAPGRARVEKIIKATIELLRVHQPEDITMAMLARQADITRTSIYAHFDSIEAIFEQISVRFTQETGVFVEAFVRQRDPKNLTDILTITIDGICAYFNNPDLVASDGFARHVPFDTYIVVKDFDKVSALLYHTLWDCNWPIEPLSEFDPFRLLVLLQSAFFSTSIKRYGYITESFAQQTKQMACDFILGADARFKATTRHEADTRRNDRLKVAVDAIASAKDPRLIEIATQQLETLARVMRD